MDARVAHEFPGRLRQTDCDLSTVWGGGGGCAAHGAWPDLAPYTARTAGNALVSVTHRPWT